MLIEYDGLTVALGPSQPAGWDLTQMDFSGKIDPHQITHFGPKWSKWVSIFSGFPKLQNIQDLIISSLSSKPQHCQHPAKKKTICICSSPKYAMKSMFCLKIGYR